MFQNIFSTLRCPSKYIYIDVYVYIPEHCNIIQNKNITHKKNQLNYIRIAIPFISWSTGAFLNKKETDSAINSWTKSFEQYRSLTVTLRETEGKDQISVNLRCASQTSPRITAGSSIILHEQGAFLLGQVTSKNLAQPTYIHPRNL